MILASDLFQEYIDNGIIYDWIVFLSIYLWYQFVMVLPHDILTFDVSCIHNGVNDT